MSHFKYLMGQLRSTRSSCCQTASTISGRLKSRVYCRRISSGLRPGTAKAQSGWARYRSLSGLTASGSTHRPRSRPSSFTRRQRPGRPSGSFAASSAQSPRLEEVSLRPLNQPSSSTNRSMSAFWAAAASCTRRSSSKSK